MTLCYHMYGTDIADLIIYVQDGSGARTQVWNKSGDQGDQWLNDTVDPGSVNGTFKVSRFVHFRFLVCLVSSLGMSFVAVRDRRHSRS